MEGICGEDRSEERRKDVVRAEVGGGWGEGLFCYVLKLAYSCVEEKYKATFRAKNRIIKL
jgi:hypothetical protein